MCDTLRIPNYLFMHATRLVYKDAPLKTIVIRPLMLGSAMVYTTNTAAFRQVLALNSDFQKSDAGTRDFRFLSKPVATTGNAVLT